MADNLCESADDVKKYNNVKYKILYPKFIKELQNVWNWNATMDLRRTDIKQQNTVKPVLVVTSIKQPTCIKQPEKSCSKIHIPIYLNCIKQPPAFSSHFLSFPWVAA